LYFKIYFLVCVFYETVRKEGMLQIKTNAVVSIHYTLTDKNGEVLDTSSGKEPLGLSSRQGPYNTRFGKGTRRQRKRGKN